MDKGDDAHAAAARRSRRLVGSRPLRSELFRILHVRIMALDSSAIRWPYVLRLCACVRVISRSVLRQDELAH